MKDYLFYVYIMATGNNHVLYIGVTNNMKRRAIEHKHHLIPGFSANYNVDKLVYFESFGYINDAIHREKRLKKWNREWKENLIRSKNPDWQDLALTL
ncbi:MAG: GIY-YIG nuclease family protein [Bacteroidia bacterium]|nr:GIY-YIG nuclease family protein [Bacteroidia bacterium]